MSNQYIRELKEMQNLFCDPKFSRQAWKAVGQAIALQPAVKPIATFDKDGNETYNSQIESYSYNSLAKDIASLGKENREPTELEMILHCQMIKARTDTSAAVFIRDTLGAKPVDESKVDAQLSNPYEQLTDEELEVLQEMRNKKAAEAAQASLQDPFKVVPYGEVTDQPASSASLHDGLKVVPRGEVIVEPVSVEHPIVETTDPLQDETSYENYPID